ncbi:LIM/homeobox protein Awh-like [Saccostrea echinata]|uniref:LIM/homeobox protein Awh-like n=1 Tax=Saccostrea echinata TaxID=191078 RepID=UPI002A813580|nr:LIM/homeobox protein Awh-like [Saccostrea echinata]
MLTELTRVDLSCDQEMMMTSYEELGSSSSSLSSDSAFAEQLTSPVESCEDQICEGCHELILDRYFLHVNGGSWHSSCLRCCVCCLQLDQEESCFVKDDNIYCRQDYIGEFGTKCSKCFRRIQSTDWVRRARDNVYHLACFACDTCQRQLSTGEEFALNGDQVLCLRHYTSLIEGGTEKDSELSSKPKAKRVRSSFTEEQLQILQANFRIESNPDSQELNRIALTAGVSRRVAQVWFQNARARQKKQQIFGSNQNSRSNSKSYCNGQWSSGSEGQLSDSTSE